MIRHALISAVIALGLATALSNPARAQMADSLDDIVTVALLDGWRDGDGSHYAGIHIKLQPGWKTYWRAPGDGGIPTRASWKGSTNLANAAVYWPHPQVFRINGLRSLGYANEVVLPVRLMPKDNGAIQANLQLRFGVCKDVCLPVRIKLKAVLTDGPPKAQAEIRQALKQRARTGAQALHCTLIEKPDGYRLDIITNVAPLEGNAETAVVELGDRSVWVSEPRFGRDDGTVWASVRMIPQGDKAEVDLSTVRLTLLTTTSAVELKGCD